MIGPWKLSDRFGIKEWQRRIPIGARVVHRQHGEGTLDFISGETCVIRYGDISFQCKLEGVTSWRPAELTDTHKGIIVDRIVTRLVAPK